MTKLTPMDPMDVEALLRFLGKHRKVPATLTLRSVRTFDSRGWGGPLKTVRAPVEVLKSSGVLNTWGRYRAQGIEFGTAEVVTITVGGDVFGH